MGGRRYKTGNDRGWEERDLGYFGLQMAVLVLALLQWYRQVRNVEEHRK